MLRHLKGLRQSVHMLFLAASILYLLSTLFLGNTSIRIPFPLLTSIHTFLFFPTLVLLILDLVLMVLLPDTEGDVQEFSEIPMGRKIPAGIVGLLGIILMIWTFFLK